MREAVRRIKGLCKFQVNPPADSLTLVLISLNSRVYFPIHLLKCLSMNLSPPLDISSVTSLTKL